MMLVIDFVESKKGNCLLISFVAVERLEEHLFEDPGYARALAT